MQIKLFDDETNADNKYTKKINVPQYLPSDTKPNIAELCDTSKYSKLLFNIQQSDISEEEKSFLIKAATRHIAFNYSKIADYYAHSSSEVQRLMEQSALVILDIDDAISNGYVRLTEKMKELLDDDSNV